MIRVERGSLAESTCEAVVRPVRSDLDPVSALSRDLGALAGPRVEERLRRMETLPLGSAVVTPAGDLPCSFLIHIVVMSAEEGTTSPVIQRAVKNALGRAADFGIESLAMPPLGLGVGTTEPEVAARALVELLADHGRDGLPPDEVRIVVPSDFEADLFRAAIEGVLPAGG